VGYACGDNTYRFKNPDASVAVMSKVTRAIYDELDGDTCWCYHWAEDYCHPFGDENATKFKEECENHGDS
jgi:hypothetical protein